MNSKPIIPWIGGKRRLAKQIFARMPQHQCYVEPFCGAAAIYFLKQPVKTEVINDINGELINLYRVINHHLEEFIKQFKWALVSRQIYQWQQMTNPETLTDIQRAARFYYLQKLAFGGKVDSQSFGTSTTTGPRLNLLRIEEELSTAYLRLQRTYIENLSWQKVITKYDRQHSCFFLDPPYWQTEGYGVEFSLDNYTEMAQLASIIKGAMLITVNDHPDMHKAFKGLHMETINITYTVGGKGGKKAKELLIWNDHAEKGKKLKI